MERIQVNSDIDSLRTVLVQRPGFERKHVLPGFGFLDLPGFTEDIIGRNAEKEHYEFTELLSKNGVTPLFTDELVDNALQNLKKEGYLEKWLEENSPKALKIYRQSGKIEFSDLVGASETGFFNLDLGKHDPISRPLQWMYYTRDWAVSFRDGIILTSFVNKSRSQETKLARLIFQKSDQLGNTNILFDAEKENVYSQGGDIIVLDNNNLLMGIGNLSQRKAAETLAKNLNVNIVGVKLPSNIDHENGFSWNAFNALFLHLDTVFNLVDRKEALAVPYFFEDRFTKNNPIYRLLLAAYDEATSEQEKLLLTDIVKCLGSVGFVTTFEAGSGKSKELNTKIVDFMRKKDINFTFVGGNPPDNLSGQMEHLLEVVIPETRFQASNVVAINPGQVVIYRDNTVETQKALKKTGIKALTFRGTELARWNGGPHCMTMPIKREQI